MSAPVSISVAALRSPLGTLHLAAREGVLCAVSFDDYWAHEQQRLLRRFVRASFAAAPCAEIVAAFTRYFDGDIGALDGLPADPGGTAFQGRVWAALREIAPGRTCSYRQLAAALGAPSAVRAVAAANGRNPVPIVIPCHRVIGADGRLVGYGGGLERKAWLLRHEGALF